MNRCLLVLCLACAMVGLPLFAEEAPDWPKKGDTVYLAADVAWTIGMPLMGMLKLDAPRCTPLTVRTVKETKIFLRTDAGGLFALKGPWRSVIVSNESSCRARAPVRVACKGYDCDARSAAQ